MCGCCSRAVVLDLAQEPLTAERGAELGMQHLDGDVAIVLEIVREVDGRHAAGAELALDAIVPVDFRRKTTACVGHVWAVAHRAALRSSSAPNIHPRLPRSQRARAAHSVSRRLVVRLAKRRTRGRTETANRYLRTRTSKQNCETQLRNRPE